MQRVYYQPHRVRRQCGGTPDRAQRAADLPGTAIATQSTAQTVTVSNVGNDTLNYTHVGLTSGNTAEFAIDPNTTTCNFTVPLASGHDCLIGVIFTPAAAGTRSAVLTLLDDTVTGSNAILLGGTGAVSAKAVLSPLTFASQKSGRSSAAQAVKLTNSGGLPLTISSYTFGGTNPPYFSQTHRCGATLAATASCTIPVTFKPAAAGSPSATLTVATNGGSPVVTIKGTSTAVAKPKVTLTSKANPASSGSPVFFNATVTGTKSTSPTGKVELREGTHVLATATLSGGVAAFKVLNLCAGTHVLAAYYRGDKRYPASQSAPIKQIVGAGVNAL